MADFPWSATPCWVTMVVATPLSLYVTLQPVVISLSSFWAYSISLVCWNRVRRAIWASSKPSFILASQPGTSVAFALYRYVRRFREPLLGLVKHATVM